MPKTHSTFPWMPLLALSLAASCFGEEFDGQDFLRHLKVLSSDEMEGRETGSAGFEKAAAYVVSELQKDGALPAGSQGFRQPVKLRRKQIVESGSSLSLSGQPLVLGQDAYFSTRVDLKKSVSAGLVFVGYGLRVPEASYDDFAGLDVKGKILVILSGSPATIAAPLASHFQSTRERSRVLREVGAVGYVSIPNPASMDIPWERMSLSRTRPSMALSDPGFDETQGVDVYVTFNPASAPKLFEGTPHSFAELAALAKERKELPRFPLQVSLEAKTEVLESPVESFNVVAKIPGTDPKLKDEYVILSAHLDHLGIGEPIKGDRIYNGAMDNASGCAVLLDVAASLKTRKLRRSVLLAFVTGEEKGLLGSEYFAQKPTVPTGAMVADINTDMFLPLFPLKSLTVYGLAESDLGDRITEVAQRLGLSVQPDPEPLRNAFIRSDQYSFIKKGIPSLAMKVGFEKGTSQEALSKKWLTENYHAPSDEWSQPMDLQAAGGFERVVRDLTEAVANGAGRPAWKTTSFFRRFAGP